MKIISKFKDYYDGGAIYGVDQERVYVRDTVSAEEYVKENIGFEIIGFCGKLYAFESKLPYSPATFYRYYDGEYNPKELTLYGDELADYYLKEYEVEVSPYYHKTVYKKALRKEANEKLPKWKRRMGWNEIETNRAENIANAESNKTLLDVFIKYKTPIFWYNDSSKENILLNPNLKALGFQVVKDTVTAFQEIQMFISNQLVQDTQPMTKIPNEIMGRSKGFDEYSFRNKNTIKRPKRF